MEVYTAVFSVDGTQITETEPKVVDAGGFADILSEGPVLFIGDGASKCSPVLTSPNAFFVQACPEASSMLVPAEKKLAASLFEDTAYFEPFYLKEFVPTVPKRKVL